MSTKQRVELPCNLRLGTLGAHPACDEQTVNEVQRHTHVFGKDQTQQHCKGARMTSSEFVRLLKDTPGAVVRTNKPRPSHESAVRNVKVNDIELIFTKGKKRGEKHVSFETFLALNSVFALHLQSKCPSSLGLP